MHRIVNNGPIRIAIFGVAFILASFAAAVPAAVHADDPIDPTLAASPDAPAPDSANAGPKNIVQLQNHVDGSLRVKGHVQLGEVPGPNVGPVNLAAAVNTCQSSCSTLAVALQVNLVNRNFTVFAPQNAAVAVNGGCNGCHAIAVAIQYNIGVDDPTQVPPEVRDMVVDMRQELVAIDTHSTSLAQAEAGMDAVIGQFQDLAAYLTVARDERETPAAASAAPTAPAAPAAAAAPAPVAPATASPAASPSPPASATTTPAPSPSPDPSPTPATSPSSTPTPQPSPTPP